MSCQLTSLVYFHEITKVKTFLFPALKEDSPEPQEENENEGWDEDWGSWNDDDMEVDNVDTPGQEVAGPSSQDGTMDNNHKWLQECMVSLSPANDLLAVGYEDRIVLLSQKWDKDTDTDSKFTAVWQNSLRLEEGEMITAILCLPLASQKRSTQGAPDWTCVIVGFSSGYVRMYTETGALLLSQLLHVEPVQKLKCRTYGPARYLGMAEQHEELVILYKKALVTIDGFSLYQSLRACRNQVARATASGSDSSLQPPPLAYKKWGFQEQEKIIDACSCGVSTPNPFDQMLMASVHGPSTPIRSTPPAAAMYLATGIGPYLGIFGAIEGSTQPILSEVAFAVAHKLKSAIMSAASGWLGFGAKNKEEDKQKPKIEPAAPLSFRHGLPDKTRQGDSIYLSPNNNYAATTDSFGRVIMIDVDKEIAIRMWKGYRDAQLGWFQVKEDKHHSTQELSRVAQFLVIYAPRRGILEVWTAGNGPRVAAFNVSKWCRLVCPSYGMLGLNNVTSRGIKLQAFQCALIDPTGVIKTLDVPFHLALSVKDSKRARDLHLLKKLKILLKENIEESETLETSIKSLLLDMKIASITQQGIDRVLATKYLSVNCMQRILKTCIDQISHKGEESMDIDSKLFVGHCQQQVSLLNTYDLICKAISDNQPTDKKEDMTEMLTDKLGLSQSEATHVITQLEQFTLVKDCSKTEKKVRFYVEENMSPATFLECFHCPTHVTEQESNKQGTFKLVSALSEEKRINLAQFLFHESINGNTNPRCLSVVLQDCNISPVLLMNLLVTYWLYTDDRSIDMALNLHHFIKIITSITDQSEVLVDHNRPSPWWQKIRDVCCHSNNIKASYILAVTCKALSVNIFSSQTKAKDPDADTASSSDTEGTAEWDSVAVDIEQWSLLVKQLEDVLALSCLLHMNPFEVKDHDEPIKVSVSKLLEGGRGSISGLVASYVTRNNLHPSDMFKNYNMSDSTTETATEVKEVSEQSTLEKVQGQLEVLRQRFPHSLENDVLLSNCCWENVVLWNKDPESINNLMCAMEFLRLVQNALLRQGVGSMLWHMFIVKKFTAAAQLLEKVGKPPKDRLCRKDVGIGEGCMTDFVGAVCDLIDIMMEANCEANEVPVFNIEQVWHGIRGPASLVELAIDQKSTNYGLLKHHYHLSVLMHALLSLNMKSVRVLSLFDSKGKNSFFCDLSHHPLLPNQNVDTTVSMIRKQVLSKIISCAVETLEPASPTKQSPEQKSSPLKRKSSAATKWPALALELAKEFGLDIDFFKRHHVCELYSGAHDKLAEEVLLTVNDHEQMGVQLLNIAGHRVAHYLLVSHRSEGVDLLTKVPTTLSTWLKQLNASQLRCCDVPVQDTAMLLQHVANNLPEGYSDYDLAISLVDLVQSLS